MSTKKSIMLWDAACVCTWLSEELGMGQFCNEVMDKKVNGRVLLCLASNEELGQIGITKRGHVQNVVWNIESRIKDGDSAAAQIFDTSLFNKAPNVSPPEPVVPASGGKEGGGGETISADDVIPVTGDAEGEEEEDDDDDDDIFDFVTGAAPVATAGDASVVTTATDDPARAPGAAVGSDEGPDLSEGGDGSSQHGRHMMCESCHKMYWSASGSTTSCRMCRERDAELKDARASEAPGAEELTAPKEFEVCFLEKGPLNMVLEELNT